MKWIMKWFLSFMGCFILFSAISAVPALAQTSQVTFEVA